MWCSDTTDVSKHRAGAALCAWRLSFLLRVRKGRAIVGLTVLYFGFYGFRVVGVLSTAQRRSSYEVDSENLTKSVVMKLSACNIPQPHPAAALMSLGPPTI